jgi:hypothetical protein
MQNSEKPPVGNRPSENAADWFGCAVGTAIVLAIAVAGAAVYVFSGATDQQVVARAQALSPFGVAAFALTTFLTVVWRGILSTEQLNEQTRQNNAKDDENLAKLLIDGTKLIGEPNDINVIAGIAALQAVVTSPRGSFAVPAMDLLADKIFSTDINVQWKIYSASVRALNAGATTGYRSSNNLSLISSDSPESESIWLGLRGVPQVSFTGGYFIGKEFGVLDPDTQYRFNKTTFDGCEINQMERRRFMHCVFRTCRIRVASYGLINSGALENCDLSGLRLVSPLSNKGINIARKIAKGRNWYYSDDPPDPYGTIEWEKLCEVRDRDADGSHAT